MKRLVLILFISLSFVFVPTLQAHGGSELQEAVNVSTANVSPDATSIPTPVNSFELFWPLSAGKTRADRFYILKVWKENVRSWFIFGKAEKGSYQVLRATKRILEAESLIKGTNNDLATTTVGSANSFLVKSKGNLTETSGKDDLKVEIKNRLDNLIKLVDELTRKTTGELHSQLELTHDLIEQNLGVIKPSN